MTEQERDPSPVGSYELPDEPAEVTNDPDNARASDAGMAPEPEDRGGE